MANLIAGLRDFKSGKCGDTFQSISPYFNSRKEAVCSGCFENE